MFFKILKGDIKNGIFSLWKNYLITFLIFIFFSLLFFLTRRVTEYINPDIITQNVTFGDYLLHIFAGNSISNFQTLDIINGSISFEMPSLWFFLMIWLLYITLQYPYRDLCGFGKHIIIQTERRHYWWFSKCIWAVLSVLFYFLLAFAAILIFSSITGGTPVIDIADFSPYDYVSDIDFIQSPPFNMLPSLAITILVSIALVLAELVLSLIIGPKYSYILLAGGVIASSYSTNPFLLSNYAMAIRNVSFVKNGLNFSSGTILSIAIILICVIAGYFMFKNLDILSGEYK